MSLDSSYTPRGIFSFFLGLVSRWHNTPPFPRRLDTRFESIRQVLMWIIGFFITLFLLSLFSALLYHALGRVCLRVGHYSQFILLRYFT
jgi:hypothetical protein